jgi:hypothetical protein
MKVNLLCDPDGKFPFLIPLLIILLVTSETTATTAVLAAGGTLAIAAVADGINNYTPSANASTSSVIVSGSPLMMGMDGYHPTTANTKPTSTTTTTTNSTTSTGGFGRNKVNTSTNSSGAGGGRSGRSTVSSSGGRGGSSTQSTNKKGSLYRTPGERTPSGKPYVGRTKHADPAKRGSRDGRQRKTEDKVGEYDANNVQEGRKKEQELIDKEKLENLDNKRNEIKPPPAKKD